jgi:hypothetical protein
MAPTKYTQIAIFGLQLNHPATLKEAQIYFFRGQSDVLILT